MTWLRTEGNYGAPGSNRTGRTLPKFTPRTGNAGISYIAHGWTMRAMMNYTSDRMVTYNANESRRVYANGHTQVDFKLAYAFSRRYSVYADVINVFNVDANSQYTYIKDRVTFRQSFASAINFGISGTF